VFPILFFAGPVGIRTAGVVALAALFVGAWFTAHRLERRGLPRGLAYDVISPALLAGLLAARVVYALAFDPAWYFERPMELLAVWKGGFAEEGGFLGALAAAVWWCRRRGVSLWVFGDAVAPGVALGLTVARAGSLLSGSGYGTPASVPWAVTFSDPNAAAPLGIPLHPTQAYEAFAALLLTVILLLAERRARPGELLLALTLGLGLERGFFDSLRGDAIWITDWMTSGQLVAAVVAGVLVSAFLRNAQPVPGEGTR
jgi:phosphatidylglycerol:prolipoprotein diacylglycerol transferase